MTTDNFVAPGSTAHPVPMDVVRGHGTLEFAVEMSVAARTPSDALVLGVFTDATLPVMAEAVNAAAANRLSVLLKHGDLSPKAGSTLVLYDLPGVAVTRAIIVSLGSRDDYSERTFIQALAGAQRVLKETQALNISIALADFEVPGRSLVWHVRLASRIIADSYYRFMALTAKPNGGTARSAAARRVALLVKQPVTPELKLAARQGQAIAEGMALAKDLGNLPGNVCNPAYLADTARALGREYAMTVDVLERADMERLGMSSALSVGRASAQPCKFIIVKYSGTGSRQKPIVLVGKGVTFDTGGVSLKPGDDLDMMKYDMCGGASVLGAMKTVARLALPLNVIGIVGAVENMPGGNASRPGDVVLSMSGLSIEILNTDAEGRLVLCDALTYAERFDPECVVDIATLTGACVIALGTQTSGLFANDDVLARLLYQSGADAGDRAWRMPLWDEYQEQLKSNFADMSNLGGRPAGAVTAACFLARFTKSFRWAHLDIAGTASVGGDAKGATGRPVPLLSEFLLALAHGSLDNLPTTATETKQS